MSKSEKQGATTACKEWSGKWKKCSLRGEFKEREREIPLEQTKVLFENAMILGFHSIERTKLK